jgi:hypothetical protein
MPPLNWTVFESLPGATSSNFEVLCRALIRRHYGRFGDFVALANQPGVEFHLKLHTACSLGDSARWYGWQCRWYELPSGRAIGNTRRTKIVQSIAKTEKEITGLTDWVLWTRYPLTKGDQKWFRSLQTRMRLHQWTADEVETYLCGEAEILRGTYFGELVLTPNALVALHAKNVAPIKRRWQPEVHQTVEAERQLRRMLGESRSWDDIQELAVVLNGDAKAVDAESRRVVAEFARPTVDMANRAREAATALKSVYVALSHGDLDLLRQQLADPPTLPDAELRALPRRLRGGRQRAALYVANAFTDARRARLILETLTESIDRRLVAVRADAGCGKTELAAQLTAPMPTRPAGILLHGSSLQAGDSLDDLARSVVIQGKPVPSMEALIAALDAAGQRACQRLPLVIDGLNEAEDPRVWKNALAALCEMLSQYPYVLVVSTLRTAFIDEALPEDIVQLEILDFDRDTGDAIRRYFDYYQIDPTDAEFEWDYLKHPLTLRLFCEVTNPKRERIVGIEAIPRSLTALFDRYLAQAAARIAELAPRTHRYFEADVRCAIAKIGASLWDNNARTLDQDETRCQLGDENRPWNESIFRALEQEGILLGYPGDGRSRRRVAVVYDAFAGHIVGDALLERYGSAQLEEWLRQPSTMSALTEADPQQHPLSADIIRALAGLVPRRLHGKQLWALIVEPLRSKALRLAADLESSYLDAETVAELAKLVLDQPAHTRSILNRLYSTRGVPNHPLNAEFLDRMLRMMSVADRDLRWTEWIRFNGGLLGELPGPFDDLTDLTGRWRNLERRSAGDCLRARWTMWQLTSTVRPLRDQATCALYWFGRGDPAALFELSLDSLSINDPYVPERLLAASYGVVMAQQFHDADFVTALSSYLLGLRERLAGAMATSPTNHWLARLYVQGTVTFARLFYADAVPEGLEVDGRVPFASRALPEPLSKDDERAAEVRRTLYPHFENYTIARLCADRHNYDMNHEGYQAAVAQILGVIWDLGWREGSFRALDNEIAEDRYRRHPTSPGMERYGKKYGWIGFYTHAGMLADSNSLPNSRLSDVDIDPSFPEQTSPTPVCLPLWRRRAPADNRRWIRQGDVSIPNELLYCSELESTPGPWIAVHGDLRSREESSARMIFGEIVAMLVLPRDVDQLVKALKERIHPGGWWLPEEPRDNYLFAGEIPWFPEFGLGVMGSLSESLYHAAIRVTDFADINVEILAHTYGWESYHSSMNKAGGALVPSSRFSKTHNLRGMPQSFGQVAPDGTWASLSLGGPDGVDGRLLYLREDLLHSYAAGRQLVQFTWMERLLQLSVHDSPKWLNAIQHAGQNIWRRVSTGDEISSLFATKQRDRARSKRGPRKRR